MVSENVYLYWLRQQEQKEPKEEPRPYLPLIRKGWEDYLSRERAAVEAQQRGIPLKWWEYQRGIEAQKAPMGMIPMPEQYPGLLPTYQPPKEYDLFDAQKVTDWQLWAYEEMVYGLGKWADEWEAAYIDSHETAATQWAEKTGWRKVTEPIKHALMGVANLGLLKVLGPAWNTPQYMLARLIGNVKRNASITPTQEEITRGVMEYLETTETAEELPDLLDLIWVYGTKGVQLPTLVQPEFENINAWLDAEYGEDPELRDKAELMAREVDRISFSWAIGTTVPPEDFEFFKKTHTRLMEEAQTKDDVDRILRQEQNLVKELAYGVVLDPLNITKWMGWNPLQNRSTRLVAERATVPLEEKLDFYRAASEVTPWYKTPMAKVRKVGEIVHDRLTVYLAGKTEDPGEIPGLLKKFVDDPAYDSVDGQLVKRVLEGMDTGDVLKGVDKATDSKDMLHTVVHNVAEVARAKEKALIRNTHWGKAADDFTRYAQTISAKQKQILSPLFLGWNPMYWIGNIWDNTRNIFTRCGWRRLPAESSIGEHIGFGRRGIESFFADQVGAVPQRMATGFSATPAELGIDLTPEATAEVASIWTRLKKLISPGPFLEAAGENEANMSALAIYQSYVTRWAQNWNDMPSELPYELKVQLMQHNPAIAEAVQAMLVGKWNYDEVLAEASRIHRTIVEGAVELGQVKSIGWYLQQLTKDERAAITQHPDIMAQIAKLGDVKSEAARADVISELRDMIQEGITSVAKAKHINDLKAVGWAHRSAETFRAMEPITHRFADNPLVSEMLGAGDRAHDFDLLRRIADTYGTDVYDMLDPMDDAVYDLIRRGGTPAELWEYLTTTYPFMAKYYPQVSDWELLQEAGKDSTVQMAEYLSNLDEITPTLARDTFWDIYKTLMPRARQQLVNTIPEVGAVRDTPSYNPVEVVEVVKKMKAWITAHPGAAADDYDELQHAVNLAKQYVWYKLDAQNWTDWANSSWEIDRLPDTLPSIYDIYRRYADPLKSAIDKLDTRSFRDLDPSMSVPPALWERVMDWLNTTVRKDIELAQYATMRQALWDRDYAILDYGDKTIFDALASVVIPFEFWPVHSTWNWLKYFIDNPHYLSWLNTSRRLMEDQAEKDPLMPERLRGWMPLGIGGMVNFFTGQEWTADTEYYIQPQRILIPLETMPVWGDVWLPDTYQDIARGREYIFFQNMWSTSPIVFDSLAILANRILPWAEENQPWLAEKIQRYIPEASMVVHTGYWSGTRGIRGGSIFLEPLLNRMGIEVPPEGWNPEGFISDVLGLGLGRVSPNEEYWRYQRLAGLAGTGEITSEEATEAFATRSGPAWETAIRLAAEQTAVPAFLRWSIYAPIKIYPSEERVLRGMGLIYDEAYKRYEAGDRYALQEFYAVYPDYRFRQLAYRYWDVASGKMTEEDWDSWIALNNRVNEYYGKRGQLERERQYYLGQFIPGTPEHYRTIMDFRNRRTELNQEYGDELTNYFEFLADNRRQYIHWRDGPKAQAMRKWMEKWYEADPDGKQKMLEDLPETVLEVAMEVRQEMEPRLFTQLEARQTLVRNDLPVDAVYRELNNQAAQAWDLYYTNWWEENTPYEVQDLYAAYLEMEFPANVNYRKVHPELDKALDDYTTWRDGILNTELDPTSELFLANIRVLHPDWDNEKMFEVMDIAKSIGKFTVSEFVYIKGTDREMVVSELWRFWTTLPERSLARTRAKEILGPRFSEIFLAGNYHEISDYELALWFNLLPEDWHSLVPEGRREPFGTGPTPMSESEMLWAARRFTQEEWDERMGGMEWIPPEPEEKERYEFAPAAREVRETTEADVRASAQEALEDARKKLRAGEPIDKIELPTPGEELEYQTAYAMVQRAFEGETDLWNHPLVEKWFPPNSPSRRFWQFWYANVPPGQLGAWAKDHPLVSAILDKVSRSYVIEDAYRDALVLLIEELPKHDIGDPREYAQARAEAEQYYALVTPELEHLREIYFSLPTGQRRAFLEQYPQLLGLFNAQNEFKATHPIFRKYYDPDWVPRDSVQAGGAAAGGGGGAGSRMVRGTPASGISWKAFVASAGPLAMAELFEYWSGRKQLSAATRTHLKTIWEASGTEMSFDEWLSYIKMLWLQMGTSTFKTPRPPRVDIPRVSGAGPRVTQQARWRMKR